MTLENTRKLVVATRNRGKKREFAQMLSPLGLEVLSLDDVAADLPEIEENGSTFEANAEIKARTVAEHLHMPVIADDSGITVEKLGGAPGVFSARYAGEHATDAANIAKLLTELEQLGAHQAPEGEVKLASGLEVKLLSRAAFVCSIVYIHPVATEVDAADKIVCEGRVEGYVIDQPAGAGGFGYDPIFYVPELQRTMAELSAEEKHAISHRGKALRQLLEHLRG